ncbi:ABC transporter ATP-binding protein [Enterococcus sp. DIV0876]|uniref:ABC transporter ATP-binding protein n=1 Tax=Enterococcus sp. DIV0876 TaxID=2774633 RepID=UPI003D2FB17B
MSLIANQCTYACGDQILQATIHLEPGQTKAIYGPSGSGKSTLFRLLSGLGPDSFITGDYQIDGQDVATYPIRQRAETVSLLFQNPDTQFCMQTPREELYFCLENRCIAAEEMEDRVENILVFCEIGHLADRPFHQLSGGEKQLAALACCLIMESRYLLLDEPFANLDIASKLKIIQKISTWQQESHIGILLIDHQINDVTDWVNSWYLLESQCKEVDTSVILRLHDKNHQALTAPPTVVSSQHVHLTLKDVSYSAGDQTIVFPDKSFHGGEIIGITGQSGIGKSTFLKVLLQQHPYDGSVFVQSKILKKSNVAFDHMSWIMQNPQDQFIATTVSEELKVSGSEDLVPTILADINLLHQSEKSPFLLSQGQQRRLAVASLIQRPVDILLVDEPTYGQDIKQAWQIMMMLHQVAAKGTLVLIVSHDQSLLQSFCSQIIDFNQFVKENNDEKNQSKRQTFHDFGHRVAHFFSK